MVVEAAGRSDIGRVREKNEDAFAFSPPGAEPFWAVLFDGMGGHAAGEVAAAIALETFREGLADLAPGADAAGRLAGLAAAANDRVLRAAEADPFRFGMGTTFVGLVLEGARATVSNLGDSRAYRLRAGRLERLTEDHTVARDLVRQGLIEAGMERRVRQGGALTRIIGLIEPDYREPESRIFPVEAEDAFLLCSDGLTNAVPEEAIAEALSKPPAAAVDRLVEAALAAGAPDNVTVIVLRPAG